MSQLSRRGFLRAASIGAAATGVAAAGSGVVMTAVQEVATSAGPTTGAADLADITVEGPIVAHVVDASSGTVAVYHGQVGTTVIDHQLARAIAAAAR